MKRTHRSLTVGLLLIAGLLGAPAPAPAQSKPVKGAFTVTARLLEIPSKLPPDELYDYAYVMKYQVEGGERDKQLLLVAHYKPRQPRAAIQDTMKKLVSGSLKRFAEGERHQLTLAPQIKKVWRGALVDEYFATDRKSPRYFCLKADPAKPL